MAVSGFSVWISLQNSAVIKLFHSTTYENLCDVNVAPAVTKMLAGNYKTCDRVWKCCRFDPRSPVLFFLFLHFFVAGCDDIIRQHKAACLRVTALLACKDLLWIGTSAGVVLTMAIPPVASSTTKLPNVPNVVGLYFGSDGKNATTGNYLNSSRVPRMPFSPFFPNRILSKSLAFHCQVFHTVTRVTFDF